ncbi:hypothetical protein J2793_006405 [Paraburkholderia caledonica]|uniref:Uncharacterized protein n=1 Tax=Paraburkholderia caledonica TaxID=134536 RepID=A0AB73IM06_9BURK|nr:hypothetical protein [Paraburkholderia caledonica]
MASMNVQRLPSPAGMVAGIRLSDHRFQHFLHELQETHNRSRERTIAAAVSFLRTRGPRISQDSDLQGQRTGRRDVRRSFFCSLTRTDDTGMGMRGQQFAILRCRSQCKEKMRQLIELERRISNCWAEFDALRSRAYSKEKRGLRQKIEIERTELETGRNRLTAASEESQHFKVFGSRMSIKCSQTCSWEVSHP